MVNASRPVIFVLISFLVVMLIYGSVAISRSPAFAAGKSPRDVCQSNHPTLCICNNDVENLKAKCCDLGRDLVTPCMTCDINTDTGDYENCVVSRKSPTTGQANVPQGGGVLEQPQKHPKHGGTVLPKGGGALENPSTDQGTNSKKGNDNSPTPPACPDKGPIPPNCTLKPKF
jgi:hypothetical protein